MSLQIRAQFDLIRRITAASIIAIPGNYVAAATPFSNSVRLLFVQNLTDSQIMFSINPNTPVINVNDNFSLAANGFLLLDVSSNRAATANELSLAANNYIWARDMTPEGIAAPTTGSVWISAMYAA